jgi:hypothetical protein
MRRIGCVPASAGDFLLLPKALELLRIPKSDVCKSLHLEELAARDLRSGGGSQNLADGDGSTADD